MTNPGIASVGVRWAALRADRWAALRADGPNAGGFVHPPSPHR